MVNVTGAMERRQHGQQDWGYGLRNCKRMAINGLLEQMCEEEGVGFVDL